MCVLVSVYTCVGGCLRYVSVAVKGRHVTKPTYKRKCLFGLPVRWGARQQAGRSGAGGTAGSSHLQTQP